MCIWAYVIVNICVICQCECVSYVRGWVCTSVCSWVLLLSGEDYKQRGLTPVSAGLRKSMLSKGDLNGVDNPQTAGCLPTFALTKSNRPTQIPGSWCCCLSGQQRHTDGTWASLEQCCCRGSSSPNQDKPGKPGLEPQIACRKSGFLRVSAPWTIPTYETPSIKVQQNDSPSSGFRFFLLAFFHKTTDSHILKF